VSYDNSLRGALFTNDRKTNPNHPDYRGSIQDDQGREFWVSAWIKTPRNGGDRFLSLALTPKDDAGANAPRSSGSTRTADDFLNDNKSVIDKHKKANAPAQPPANPDYDSFDDDIPF